MLKGFNVIITSAYLTCLQISKSQPYVSMCYIYTPNFIIYQSINISLKVTQKINNIFHHVLKSISNGFHAYEVQ
jgi:hypothetical protein